MITEQQTIGSVFDKLTWDWKGYKIGYTVMGTGQPLVLLHGFGASIGHWRKNIPVLAAAGYQVFAIDLLGFGSSDKPPLNYTMEVWEELVKDFWTAHIQQRAVFVGNSIGGLLSLMVIANHPEIAAGGVLINCAGGLSHRPHELNPPLRLVMGAFNRLLRSKITGKVLFNRVRQKGQIRRSLMQVYRDRTAITDELVDLLYQPSCDPGAQQVFVSILTAPPGPTPAQLLPKVKCPLLVIWGEADPWTPINGAKIYQELSNSGQPVQVKPIANAGHCPHDEAPDKVNPLIIDWLAEIG